MKTKIMSTVLLLGIGHISGQYFQSAVMKKRMNKILPLIQNSIADVIAKGIDQEMDQEELRDAMKEELKFIKIAMQS